MIFHFLSLTAVVSAQELGTDCNAVRSFVYPDAPECDFPQFCSGEMACSVTEDCDQYSCRRSTNCPVDTTFKVFSPQIEQSSENGMSANTLDGYYCAKDGLVCGFNDEGDFFIEAIVKNREPWNGKGTPDNRKVSMISKSKYEESKNQRIFKQFSTSQCFGTPIENDNKILFEKTALDSVCMDEMDFNETYSNTTGQYYTVDFFIGYDDLWDLNIFGLETVRKGGVANHFQCIMKASESGDVNPNPASSSVITYEPSSVDVPFDLKFYINDEFTQEMGSTVDLSDGSSVEGLFVEGSTEVTSPPGAQSDMIFHFKECIVSLHRQIGEENGAAVYDENDSSSRVFLYNGCLTVSNYNFVQNSSRVHWTDGDKISSKDQFYLQFGVLDESWKIKYECDYYLCELDAIKEETDPKAPCFLAEDCKNRYDNLYSDRKRRSVSTDKKKALYKAGQQTGEFIIKRSDDVNDPALSSSSPASSTPASSTPVSSTPASSTPVSSTPASSTSATTTPATTTPGTTTSNALQQAVASAALIFFVGIF